MRSLVTAGFLGWTLFVLVHIFDSYVLTTRLEPHRGQIVRPHIHSNLYQETVFTAVVSITLAAVLYIQHCPLIYYAYAGFPVFFWEEVISNRTTLKQGMKVLMQIEGKSISAQTLVLQILIYLGILESLVLIPLHPRVPFGGADGCRYMDIFIDMCLVFVLYSPRPGHSPAAQNFGKVILDSSFHGRFVVL